MEKVVLRDNAARMRAAAYLSPLAILFASVLTTLPIILYYAPRLGLERLAAEIPLGPALLATFVAELLVIAGALWYAGALKSWRLTLNLQNFNGRNVGLGAGVGAIFFVGLMGLNALASTLGVELGSSDTSVAIGNLSGIQLYLVLFAAVSIGAPIIEELFFRGYVFGFLLKGHGVGGERFGSKKVLWAAFFSSAFFALLHLQGFSSAMDFVVLGWTFLFALVSCVLYVQTRSLFPGIAAHGLYNFASALAILLL